MRSWYAKWECAHRRAEGTVRVGVRPTEKVSARAWLAPHSTTCTRGPSAKATPLRAMAVQESPPADRRDGLCAVGACSCSCARPGQMPNTEERLH